MERVWTEEEIAYLKIAYPTVYTKDIAKKLNRSVCAVQLKANKIGLKKETGWSHGRPAKRWTQDEDEFLKRHYEKDPHKEIAKKLGRTVKAVRRRVGMLGIKKVDIHSRGFVRRVWTAEEEDLLLKLYPTTSIAEIARRLKRSYHSIWIKAQRLGVNRKTEHVWKGGNPAPNNEGERKAEIFLKERGWKIIERGTSNTPYDFVIEKGNKKYSINVKFQGYLFSVLRTNLKRLEQCENPALLLITKEEDEIYLLPIQHLN